MAVCEPRAVTRSGRARVQAGVKGTAVPEPRPGDDEGSGARGVPASHTLFPAAEGGKRHFATALRVNLDAVDIPAEQSASQPLRAFRGEGSMQRVFVLDTEKRPLDPCISARARLLLRPGKEENRKANHERNDHS
jgi:hypothetical protein